MRIDQLSAAADGGNNEDCVSVFRGEHFTDIVIMDGGTSVADSNYLDRDEGDVVWFVKSFSSSLRESISRDKSQEESVVLALAKLKPVFRDRARAGSMPLYAYPIAAMTWVRIIEGEGAVTLEIYALGDCKTFLRLPDRGVVDLDPYTNPQELVLQNQIAELKKAGVVDPAERLERLMPILRARREFQNTSESPQVLCLAPRGPFDARKYTVHADPASMLLTMTDGFYRIVDTYQLRSIESLTELCIQAGLKPAMKELRDFEATSLGAGDQAIKRADDASAVICVFS